MRGPFTSAFGAAFGLEAEHIHGCDIVFPMMPDSSGSPGFAFAIASSDALPYEDEQFQLVSFIMSAHHFTDLTGSLREARRVLSPDGVLMIREHDCRTKAFGIFLDLVHYIYAAVISTEVDLHSDFEAAREGLAATYRTKSAWTSTICAAGFKLVGGFERKHPDMFNSYYAYYAKRS